MKTEICRYNGALLECWHEGILVVCILCVLLILFYLTRFFKTLASSKNGQWRDYLPSIVFWICSIINPTLLLIQMMFHNIWDKPIEYFLFTIVQPLSMFMPYTVISHVMVDLGAKLNPGASNDTKQKVVNYASYFLAVCFVIQTIICFLIGKRKYVLLLITDICTVLIYLVSFTVFVVISVLMIISFYDYGISELPRRFFSILFVGLNIIALLNICYIVSQAIWVFSMDISNINYPLSLYTKPSTTLLIHSLLNIFGVLLPSFLLSIGILYLNSTPQNSSYFAPTK